jgi:ATP-dependent DNA helicase Q1
MCVCLATRRHHLEATLTPLLQDAERLATHLVTRAWLSWEYNATAYSVNVYVKPGPNSARLTRLDEEAVRAGEAGTRIEFALNKKAKRAKAANGKGKAKKTTGKKKASPSKGKRKRSSASDESASDSDSIDSDDEREARDADVSAWSEPSQPKPKAGASTGGRRLGGKLKRSSLVPASEADDDEWEVFQASEAASSSRAVAAKPTGTSRGGGGGRAEAPIELD